MVKCLILLMMLFSSISVQAIEYIQKYKTYVYNDSFNLEKILKQENCTKIELQKQIFQSRYKKLKKGQKVKVQTCYQDELFTDDLLNIERWDLITVQKKFILSKALEKNQCSKIYTKQIPHFYLKNKKKPTDVNIFRIGQKIQLQKCKIDIEEKDVVVDISDEQTSENDSDQRPKEKIYTDELAARGILNYKGSADLGLMYKSKKIDMNFYLARHSFELNAGFGFNVSKNIRPHLLIGRTNADQIQKSSSSYYLMPGVNYTYNNFIFGLNYKIEKSSNFNLEIDYQVLKYMRISFFSDINDVSSEREFGLGLKYLFW